MKRRKRIQKLERHRRKRNYKLEYRRRIARGLARGRSRSQARGHARASDVPRSSHPPVIDLNDPRERALRKIKDDGLSMKAAAKTEKISTERLRRYVKENVEATQEGRRWKIVDRRSVEMAICSRAKLRWVTVSHDQASTIGHYWVAVNRFLRSNESSHLTPFIGKGVRDAAGKYHPFETGPNNFRRLDSADELSFLEIYKHVR
jgi:hypothetical protein